MSRATATAVATVALVLALGITAFATHWKAPDAAKKIRNPIKPAAASVERGRQLYGQSCAKCHGRNALGDGPVVGSLRTQGGLNLTILGTETDGEIFWKISAGRVEMPPWELVLKPEDRWHLINYLRTLMKK